MHVQSFIGKEKGYPKFRILTRILRTGVPGLSLSKSGSPTIQKNIAALKKYKSPCTKKWELRTANQQLYKRARQITIFREIYLYCCGYLMEGLDGIMPPDKRAYLKISFLISHHHIIIRSLTCDAGASSTSVGPFKVTG